MNTCEIRVCVHEDRGITDLMPVSSMEEGVWHASCSDALDGGAHVTVI